MKEISLTQGMIAIVDDEDYEELSKHKWHFMKVHAGYAARNNSYKIQYMHRLIASAGDGMVVDHINGNTLDNRRCNLRVCSQSQNTKNKGIRKGKKTKGVSLRKSGRWSARIFSDGVSFHIGTFDTEEEAADAYKAESLRLHGEFSSLNR